MRAFHLMILISIGAMMARVPGQDFTDSLLSVVLEGAKVDSPRITIAPDGRLLVCARRMEPGPATLLLYASENLGKTWEVVHDFAHNYYGPTFFELNGAIHVFLRDTTQGDENLILAKSEDVGLTWEKSVMLPPCIPHPQVALPPGRTIGNTPVLVTETFIIAAVSDWGGEGAYFPQAGRIACGWCPVAKDPMRAENWTWTNFLEMPSPNSAPDDKGGWLEPNPVIAPNGDLLLLVRVDSDEGELGAVVQVDMKRKTLVFEDRFPARPGQSGFIHMPGGGNGMFFVGYDEACGRYLCASNPRTGGATELWRHKRIRNALVLFESTNLYDWKRVRTLVRDDQDTDWKTSATHCGFQQPSWVVVEKDLYVVSRTAYGQTKNWHDANQITVHKLSDYQRYLNADGEVAHYRFDSSDDLGLDSSRQGGNRADLHGVLYDHDGHEQGCIRFDGKGYLDLRYRVSSEFHHAEQIGMTFWMNAERSDGQVIDFPIDGKKNGISVRLKGGSLVVGGRSCVEDDWQSVECPLPELGGWHHVAMQIDYLNKRIDIWVNGGKADVDGSVQFQLPFYRRGFPTVFDVIGRNHNGGESYVGRLDGVRFFRRALSRDEIAGDD